MLSRDFFSVSSSDVLENYEPEEDIEEPTNNNIPIEKYPSHDVKNIKGMAEVNANGKFEVNTKARKQDNKDLEQTEELHENISQRKDQSEESAIQSNLLPISYSEDDISIVQYLDSENDILIYAVGDEDNEENIVEENGNENIEKEQALDNQGEEEDEEIFENTHSNEEATLSDSIQRNTPGTRFHSIKDQLKIYGSFSGTFL